MMPDLTSSSSVPNTLEAAKPSSARTAGTSSPSYSLLYDVSGMMCSGCAARVKSILSFGGRMLSVVVNLLTKTMTVKMREGELSEVTNELAMRLTEVGVGMGVIRGRGCALAMKRSAAIGVADRVRKWREVAHMKEEMLVRSRNRVTFTRTLVAICFIASKSLGAYTS